MPAHSHETEKLARRWEWPIALGCLLIILGFIPLVYPIATSGVLSALLGVVLLISGAAQAIHAIQFIKHPGRFSRLLLAAASLFAGIVVMRNPAAGMVALTLTLGFFLLVSSVSKWTLASELRPNRGWGWLFFSSLVSFGLGTFLITTLPVSSLFVPAVFVGVDLISFGTGLIALALNLRSVDRAMLPKEERRAA